ncbi:MAG: hypothetical protein Q4B26_03885 [Eubacteriales bacterium]|nr:hypothetical protein [Eubacteriales bacterium]
MKQLKRTLFLTLLLLMLIPQTALAASARSKALSAYRNFLSQSTFNWPDSRTIVDMQKCEFALVYVDKNSVPELLIYSGANYNTHADGFYLLYTYKKGNVVFLGNMMDGFSYYRKKGVYCAFHGGTSGMDRYYFKLSKGKVSAILYTYDDSTYKGYDLNGDGVVAGISYYKVISAKDPMYLSVTGKRISKRSFSRILKKQVGSTKRSTVKKYPNTAANRAKYLR